LIDVITGGHCKQFAPEFEKAAENLKGIIHLGAVNCEVPYASPL